MKFGDESQLDVYIKARDCDARAAFGSVVAFNTPLTKEAAVEIMSTIVEGVVAPDYEEGALEVLSDFDTYRKNRHLRAVKIPNLDKLPKFEGDDTGGIMEAKVMGDGRPDSS